jgi:hypothetical protein
LLCRVLFVVQAISSYISGGSSYAVLLDEQAYARGSSCHVDGPCHDSSEVPLPQLPHRRTGLHASGPAGDSNSSSNARLQPVCAAGAGTDDLPLRQKYNAVSAQQQQQHDTEMWQQPAAAAAAAQQQCSSPFSTGACSDTSSPDMLVYMAGSSKDATCDAHSGYLVCDNMLVQDAAAAAALFPAEQGAFAVEQRMY